MTEADVLTDGRRALLVKLSAQPISVKVIGDDLQLVDLPESGHVPIVSIRDAGLVALGPTGLVVTDGSQIWLGLPLSEPQP
jgi:hypothetical protein